MLHRITRSTLINLTLAATGVAGFTLGSVYVGSGPVTENRSYSTPGPGWHRPCEQEDGPGPCFWNANNRGNNNGTDVHLDRHGRVWVPTRDVRRHDGCYILVRAVSRVRCDDGYRTTRS